MRRVTGIFVTAVTLAVFAGAACRDATEPAEPDPLLSGLLTGDVKVVTTTTGANLDPDGYTATLDLLFSKLVASNGSVTFPSVVTGVHVVRLSGVASNCTVSGGDSRTVVVLLSATVRADFAVECKGEEPPPPPPPPAGTRVTGLGAIGPGAAAPGQSRVDFDFDVVSDLSGRVFIRDWAVIRQDGTTGTLTVDTDPATGITAFRNGSATCGDPTRGAEFDGVGRVNTGGDTNPAGDEWLAFTVTVCDNGSPGVNVDVFGIAVPGHGYTSGPDGLSAGEVTKSTS